MNKYLFWFFYFVTLIMITNVRLESVFPASIKRCFKHCMIWQHTGLLFLKNKRIINCTDAWDVWLSIWDVVPIISIAFLIIYLLDRHRMWMQNLRILFCGVFLWCFFNVCVFLWWWWWFCFFVCLFVHLFVCFSGHHRYRWF